MKLNAGALFDGKDIALRCPRPYSGRNVRYGMFDREIAPLDAARTALRAVPTTSNPLSYAKI